MHVRNNSCVTPTTHSTKDDISGVMALRLSDVDSAARTFEQTTNMRGIFYIRVVSRSSTSLGAESEGLLLLCIMVTERLVMIFGGNDVPTPTPFATYFDFGSNLGKQEVKGRG